jgi:hypothetical protein
MRSCDLKLAPQVAVKAAKWNWHSSETTPEIASLLAPANFFLTLNVLF